MYFKNDTFQDDNLWILGNELIRVDHSSNQKRVGVCIYHINFLPVKVNNVSYLKKCLNFSLSVNEKQCSIILIYQSPSQTSEEFDIFLTSFELLLVYISQIKTRL